MNKKPSEDKLERRRAAKPKLSKRDLDFGLISDNRRNGSNASSSDAVSTANCSFRSEISNPPLVTNAVRSVASTEKIDDCLASDDTQLERQITVWSLESDDVGHLKDSAPPEDVIENVKNQSWNDEVKSIISGEAGFQSRPCKLCSNIEPSPDLHCAGCGIWIHRLCSPWIESSSDDDWRCGDCRDWR